MHKKLKIGYLTSRNAEDKREWSGTLYYMARSLERNVGNVVYIGPYKPSLVIFYLKILNKLSLVFLGKRFNQNYSNLLSYFYRKKFERWIAKENPDIIFAASASPEMSKLKIKQPIVYLGDITFRLLLGNYPNFSNLLNLSKTIGENIERSTFQKSAGIVVSSKWAVDSLKEDYNVPEDKIHLVSYGANLDKIPSNDEAINKSMDTLNLLFLAVDWDRKGGNIVFNSFLELLKRGMDTRLMIVGCQPPEEVAKHSSVHFIKFLDKNDEKDFNRLFKLFLETNFLFVPSRADCTPIVFCEANSFGVPVISTNVGGISSVIKNGINGFLHEVQDDHLVYSNTIESLFKNKDKYVDLVNSSRNYYEQKLNWDKWGEQMGLIFQKILKEK